MAMKIFQKLFSRKKRGHIVLSPEEAYSPIPEEEAPVNEETPEAEAAPASEEAPASKETPAEEAPAAEAAPETEEAPASEEAPETEKAPAGEAPAARPETFKEPMTLWVYACLDDAAGAKTLMRPQMIAQFRALTEDEGGFTGRLPSGASVRARVYADATYVSEQAGYVKTQYKDTFLTDRDVQNAAMMQIELFNALIVFTLEAQTAEADEAALLTAVYQAAQPLRAFVLNADMEMYRWDRRLVISPDGRTDFSVFMPIRRGAGADKRTETDAADDARRKRSMEVLKKHGVTAVCDMPVQAREAQAKLRTPEEIIQRLAAIFACALKAQAYTSPRDVVAPAAWTLKAVNRLDGQYGVNRLFTGKEADYIVRSQDAKHEEYLLRFESCAVLLWALGLYNPGWPDARADTGAMMRVIRDADTEMLLRIAKPRPLGEVLNMHDIIFRLHTLLVRGGEGALGEAKANHDVVYERHYALNWLVAVDGICDWDLIVPKT